jgi:hypothetical protein
MVWAGIVAALSVFGLLWASGRLFRKLPSWTAFLSVPALFSIGALCWSLWSGMEVAFFLGIWALATAIAIDLADDRLPVRRGSVLLGVAGVLVVLTRPEGATSLAALGVFAAIAIGRRRSVLSAIASLARSGLPAACALGLQALANKLLTGETAANGALVKLALYNPYMTPAEKLADWRFNVDYAIDRLTLHHFGELPRWSWAPARLGDLAHWGYLPVFFALVPLFDKRSRAIALVLWASVISWVLVVALNGQVRWQNERYLMPAVAWLLLLAALGIAVLVAPALDAWRRRPRQLAGAGVTVALLLGFWKGERIQYKDQVWFFARASRNIRDQHTTVGMLLRRFDPLPKRLLVGDAGALIYASDLPGFDLIGLGGYKKLPLARAGTHGLAATLELMERVPPADRPDVMAIYPTWWPSLPRWFGSPLFSVPVAGNVICGGAEKVVYRADWRLLGTGDRPRTLAPGDRIVDDIDVGDLVSEEEHSYVFPHPQGGYAEMRVLTDPREEDRDLWDAGRRIPLDRPETFRLPHASPGVPLRLTVRTVVDRDSARCARARTPRSSSSRRRPAGKRSRSTFPRASCGPVSRWRSRRRRASGSTTTRGQSSRNRAYFG